MSPLKIIDQEYSVLGFSILSPLQGFGVVVVKLFYHTVFPTGLSSSVAAVVW
jgi:hypothetical protein